MKRSQSSSAGIAAPPRRTIFPRNGGNGWDARGGRRDEVGLDFGRGSLSSAPKNVHAAEAGRWLLGRPKLDMMPRSRGAPVFAVSAAETPLRRSSTDTTLRSCLSSRGSLASLSGSYDRAESPRKNEEFALVRRVSFSKIRVREYEVTLGDNPSVSSGAPISLGWRYDPQESISTVSDGDDSPSVRRSRSELRLSDRERQHRLQINPSVSMEDLQLVLNSVNETKLQRKESLNELREQMQAVRARPRRARGYAIGC